MLLTRRALMKVLFEAPVNLAVPPRLTITEKLAQGFADPADFVQTGDGGDDGLSWQRAHDELAGAFTGIKEVDARGGVIQLGASATT